MKKKITAYQQKALAALSGRADDFYLAGGTALSLFYFRHRTSVDLDFFTQDFDSVIITRMAQYLAAALKKKVELIGRNLEKKTTRMMVYNIHFTETMPLRIDFVEDVAALLKETKVVNGIRILSLEDIYLRKLYALAGVVKRVDTAGQNVFVGGRSDAKDFYDIYFLSHTFMPLSRFIRSYCDHIMVESIIKWFRTYDRMSMMDGILTLDTGRTVDYKAMEKHFKIETDRILEAEVEGL